MGAAPEPDTGDAEQGQESRAVQASGAEEYDQLWAGTVAERHSSEECKEDGRAGRRTEEPGGQGDSSLTPSPAVFTACGRDRPHRSLFSTLGVPFIADPAKSCAWRAGWRDAGEGGARV